VSSDSGDVLANVTEQASLAVSRRVSRRSFLGRFMKTAIAVSLGSAGAEILLSRQAEAHAACYSGCTGASCCAEFSVRCGNLPGHMDNSCPNDSFACGYWDDNTEDPCFGGTTRWTDCCGGCGGGGADCQCVNGHPSCCRHKDYPQQQGDCTDHIKCRRYRCL
jgi:hypothetical protein